MSALLLASLLMPTYAADLDLSSEYPEALCVPHLSGPAPAWWNAGLSASRKAARWSGAATVKESSGSHTARTRALYDASNGEVYLELLMSGDPTLDPDSDQVILALGDEDGEGPALVLEISALAGCGVAGACEGAGAAIPESAILYSAATLGPTTVTWSDPDTTNPSAEFEICQPWVVAQQSGGVWTWTVSLVLSVPTDAAGEIRPDQRIYADTVAWWPGWTSGTWTEIPTLCTSSSPTTDDCLINLDPLTELPEDLPIGNFEESWFELRSDCAP